MLYALTGGTGSFGSALARHLLAETSHRIRVISRDEHKQQAMMTLYPPSPRLTYILLDIGDLDALSIAFHKADVVVHACAIKTVPAGEFHAVEMTRVNVGGTQNVIYASIDNCVPKTLLISSDKSVAPVNSYGKSKALAESLFVNANKLGVSYGSRFSCVRGGNVWASRGSVVEKWLRSSILEVTQPEATRFHLPMDYWLRFCLQVIDLMHGGEIFVPKCRAWQLYDLALAFTRVYPGKLYTNSGARYGDKTHELLISHYESSHTVNVDWAYVIEPSSDLRGVWDYQPHIGQSLNHEISSDRAERIPVSELENMIRDTPATI